MSPALGTIRHPGSHPRSRRAPALLPSLLQRDVRQGGRRFPNAKPPRSTRAAPTPSSKVFAYWATVNYRESYDSVRLQRHSVQPRIAAPGRDVCHPQDHPRRRLHQSRPAEEALSGQPRRQARLGLCQGIRGGHVADAAAGPTRRLCDRHRRDPFRQGVLRGSVSSCRVWTGRITWKSIRAIFAPPRSICSSAMPSKARQKLGWEPKTRFKELVAIMVDADMKALSDQLAGKVLPGPEGRGRGGF